MPWHFCPSEKHTQSRVDSFAVLAELVELLNSDRICSLRLTGYLKTSFSLGIVLFCFLFFLITFYSILLRCKCVALTLASAAKEKEEVIGWLKECPLFFFLLYNMIFHK